MLSRHRISRIAIAAAVISIGLPTALASADDNLSTTFATNVVTALGASSIATIDDLASQTDGKIVLAGISLSIGGLAVEAVGRLNADGTADTAFNTNAATVAATYAGFFVVNAVAIQSDGKILIAGNFSTASGRSRNVMRLNADGTLDTAFFANIEALTPTSSPSAAYDVVVLPSGKILVGGAFATSEGAPASKLMRLNADGTADTTFNAAVGTKLDSSDFVRTVAVAPDGKMVIAGSRLAYGTGSVKGIARLNADGTHDTAFDAKIGTGFDHPVNSTVADISAITLQSDGKIVIGGLFSTLNGATSYPVTRLNADGSKDSTFTIPTFAGFNRNSSVFDVLVTPEGKILVGGQLISQVAGTSGENIVRFNSDGSLDTDFNKKMGLGFAGGVNALALQFGESVLVGGSFTTFDKERVQASSVRKFVNSTEVRKLVRFTFQPVALTAASPATIDNLVGGTLTLTGSSLRSTTTVTVGSVACKDVKSTSSTSLTCTVPAGKAGTKLSVVATNLDGTTATLTDAVTYSTPAVTSVSPATVDNQRGGTITVTGSGFHTGTKLSVDGVACAKLTITSLTTMTCVVPAGEAGKKISVVATFIDATSSTLADAFAYIVPTVSPQKINFKFKTGANANGKKPLTLKIAGKTLYINSTWRLLMRSEPVVIGEGTVGDDGTAKIVGKIPTTVEAGAHTISLEATGADGKPITATGYLTIESNGSVSCLSTTKKCATPKSTTSATDRTTLPATGGSGTPAWPAMLMIALGAVALIVRRRAALARS